MPFKDMEVENLQNNSRKMMCTHLCHLHREVPHDGHRKRNAVPSLGLKHTKRVFKTADA